MKEVIKLAGHYLLWENGKPDGFGMTADQLKWQHARAHKLVGYPELIRAMRVADYRGYSPDSVIRYNKAGPNGKPLAKEEIAEFYVRRRELPRPEELAKFRSRMPPCGGCVGKKCDVCWGSGVLY